MGDAPGLHTNFRLSAEGKTVLLVDADQRRNQILDVVEFGKQGADMALGRYPDGSGDFRSVGMTPGRKNERQYG